MGQVDNRNEVVLPRLTALYKGVLYNVSCIDYNQNYIALWKMVDNDNKYFTLNISEIEKLIVNDE